MSHIGSKVQVESQSNWIEVELVGFLEPNPQHTWPTLLIPIMLTVDSPRNGNHRRNWEMTIDVDINLYIKQTIIQLN